MIYEAALLLREGKTTPTELTAEILRKIEKHDKDLGGYITIADNAMEEAKKAEENKKDSLLWGIPIAIKDNICTKNLLTTAASKMLENFVPPYDATVTAKLKEAGAVIIGKTNMDEFGMGATTENSAFKKTYNPVNYEYIPGGSSGGSCAVVKKGLALGAIGTDTGGSIRQPAAFCGIYGLKPTYSLVSRYGLVAFASGLDTIGPVGSSVKDLAIMLDTIAGYDPMDATSAKKEKECYFENLKENMKGLKIGVPEEFFQNMDEDIKNAVFKGIRECKDMGAEIEECSMPSLKYAVSSYYIISSSEASSNLARYDGVRFGKRAEGAENVEQLYRKTRSENFGDEVKRRILLGTYALSKGSYDLYYLKAKAARAAIKKDFDALFEKYDVLLTPVSAKRVWKLGDKLHLTEEYKKDICTVAVNLAGLPAISIPCGEDKNNMPVGMQFIGNRFAEQTLLNAAFSFEEGGEANGI